MNHYTEEINRHKLVVNDEYSYLYVVCDCFGGPAAGLVGTSLIYPEASVGSKEGEDFTGKAYYLDYPQFKGSAGNVVKIGNVDLGKKVLGTKGFPAGHGATILVDKDGNATYYEYGRYTGDQKGTFGIKRPSVQGGNWRKFNLPTKGADESDSAYIDRIYKSLPDASKSDLTVSVLNNVDTKAARAYADREANNINRAAYDWDHTCAVEASRLARKFQQ